jgi:hypothetical protein
LILFDPTIHVQGKANPQASMSKEKMADGETLLSADLNHSVEIGQGLGDIKLGFSPEDVQRHLGPPDALER